MTVMTWRATSPVEDAEKIGRCRGFGGTAAFHLLFADGDTRALINTLDIYRSSVADGLDRTTIAALTVKTLLWYAGRFTALFDLPHGHRLLEKAADLIGEQPELLEDVIADVMTYFGQVNAHVDFQISPARVDSAFV
jgi:hypothetical protein